MIRIRSTDIYGSGRYGASRGKRLHNGIDIVCHKNESIDAFESGTVTKIGLPYNPEDTKKAHLRYTEITVANGDRHRYFYTDGIYLVDHVVSRGDTIAWAQGLQDIYQGITEHYHFEIMKPTAKRRYRNPVVILKGLGHEFLG
ncbi:MAG: hypothetical protein JKY53_00125 [Flavobacteriales bacterium]|nr:hypothetical protein [Flavobacteriales bacterium]